ncbi:MAG: uroporphyrinogen decarboxylase family protein [Bryobacteraceae bacterium]|jgi:MtaA/CmuA family methyltransferase
MTSRERVIAMLEGRPVDHLPSMPITMMFAADCLGVKYGEYARDHRILAEGQIKTAEQFGFDYVSAISDPTREAADYGAKIEWYEDQPPAIIESEALLSEKSMLARLKPPDPMGGGRMEDRVHGIELLRRRAGSDKFVEGWVEGPCAEAADLRGISRLMLDFSEDPEFVRDLFEFVLGTAIHFARVQMEAGADIIGVGDAAASLVGPRIYQEFVWPFERRLVNAIHAMGGRVRLHICGNTRKILGGMGKLGCDMVDLDFPVRLEEARAQMGSRQVLAGNLNPVKDLCYGTPDTIRQALAECRHQAGPNYIVAAGCEIVRDTPHANVRALAEFAQTQK